MTGPTSNNDKIVPLHTGRTEPIKISAPDNYINRELSILKFNWRVLQQSLDDSIPVLERVRYLSICSNNLDEFFEVRVAGLRHRVNRNDGSTGPDGIIPTTLLNMVYDDAQSLVKEQYRILSEVLYPALAEQGILFPDRDKWQEDDYHWIANYFRRQVAPVITPISLDLTHPFPRLINKSLHFLLRIDGVDAFGRNLEYAVLHMPRSLSRLVRMPTKGRAPGTQHIILLSEIIKEFASELFPGMTVKGCFQFRLTRDSDLLVDEMDAEDLAIILKEELSSRDFGASVRLEVHDDCPPKVVRFLLQKCGLTERELFRVNGPVNLNRYMQLINLAERPDLEYEGFTPGVPSELEHGQPLLDRVAEKDFMLEHPYESFWPVVEMLREAAIDPQVLAIQQTLYRTGSDSPIVVAMIDAARAGKEVTAVVELRARFDEAENIALAQRLQDAGVLVVYGVMGYKTHAKMMLIVRREKNKLKRYCHLGTGNYHVGNSRAYTDYSLLTSNKQMCEDVQKMFQQLTGMGKASQLSLLWVAPFALKQKIIAAIHAEVKNVKAGGRGHVVAKLNALTDVTLITELYKASQQGVQIDLLVRGICSLKPGVPGLSETISVRSIIGRFLEHSRCYYFYSNGADNLYCSSSDWMDRNLDGRVEVCFPVLQEDIKQRLKHELLNEYLKDTGLSWHLLPSGEYERRPVRGTPRKVQERLLHALSRSTFS